ncbi:hypothetical protein PIB30_043680 [Stylosanthes scabra]|uniref:Uncharacterized protein n=1 Tax=Stylosanthes scabra TaxID=79078 RepID=A0ABU6QGC5_9FABA|nr:hypothetical protein [Stylosanthes scabra]
MLEKLTVVIVVKVMINEEMLEVTKLERREYVGKSCGQWPKKLKSSEVVRKGNEEVAEWKQMAEKCRIEANAFGDRMENPYFDGRVSIDGKGASKGSDQNRYTVVEDKSKRKRLEGFYGYVNIEVSIETWTRGKYVEKAEGT